MDINHLLTPHKYGCVLSPSGIGGAYDRLAVDCPFVFYHRDRWFMMHVGYDGIGYQTGLAVSDDLLRWQPYGVILRRGSHQEWDKVGMAGTWILRDTDLYARPILRKVQGRYWLTYHSYPGEGYENGPAEIGLAYTDDELLLDWTFIDDPVLSWRNDDNARTWDAGGLYKCCVVVQDNRYFMFYNAKNAAAHWIEQTGLAVSDDLLHWEKVGTEPLLPVTPGAWDSRFASDPCVLWDRRAGQWVMFYYGYDGTHARDGIAVSQDLYNWHKYPQPLLDVDEIDTFYAHKPSVVWEDGLYHFYCGVRHHRPGDPPPTQREFRGISLATSVPLRG